MKATKRNKKKGLLVPHEHHEREAGLWPSSHLREMVEGLGHEFDDLFHGVWPRLGVPGWGPRPLREWRMPRVDIEDVGSHYQVRAELPGIPREKVDVGVTQDRLEIRADAGSEKEEKKKGYYYREIGRRSFYRSLPLPVDADPEQVQARMEDGCLNVRIGKRLVTVKRKSIAIE